MTGALGPRNTRRGTAPPTDRQVHVLRTLARMRPVNGVPANLARLSRALGLPSRSSVVSTVEALEARGLVQRHPGQHGVYLTEAAGPYLE